VVNSDTTETNLSNNFRLRSYGVELAEWYAASALGLVNRIRQDPVAFIWYVIGLIPDVCGKMCF
jgi:hypothetical protein